MEMSSLVPWRRRDPLTGFRSEMDRLFDRFFDGWPPRFSAEEGVWAPSVDVSETAKEVIVKAELPGMDPKDVEVTVDRDILTLRGERKREQEINEENAYRLERSYGSFMRSFSLPRTVDSSRISAKYSNGVLDIVLPKAEEAKPKKVEITIA